MPNPGVYARRNAVDVPARLPDGSDAKSSVSATIRKPREDSTP
jgi:NADH-quinone oxidoreductase subunit J